MTDQIWKYTLWSVVTEIDLPVGAFVRHIGPDPASGQPAIWMQVITEAAKEKRHFEFCGTGDELPERMTREFIGTAVCREFVWHIFEIFPR